MRGLLNHSATSHQGAVWVVLGLPSGDSFISAWSSPLDWENIFHTLVLVIGIKFKLLLVVIIKKKTISLPIVALRCPGGGLVFVSAVTSYFTCFFVRPG